MTRHVPLEGNLNLRDIGGYETADGRVVRRGCLFRSDELHALTDPDLDVIAELGVRVVFDLRNHIERELRPSRLWDGAELHERESVSTEGGSGATLEELIERGELFEPSDDEFALIYIALVSHLAPELRRIVTLALDAAERPLLFHCAAGKDRTGITAALLLGLLGVPEETILDDYERTTEFFSERRYAQLEPLVIKHGANPDHVRQIVSARRRVLQTTLDHITDTWGGFEGFATEVLTLPTDVPETLRARLLDPSPT